MAEVSETKLELPVGESPWDAARSERVLGRVRRRLGDRRRERKLLGAAAGLLMLVVAGAGAFTLFDRPEPQVLREAGSLRLSDGSRVELQGDASVVEVGLMSPSYAELVLERGAARFEVTHNPERQFAVRAGNLRVEVLGTRFSLERDGARTHLVVTEGRVRAIWPGGERVLIAGEAGWFPPVEELAREQLARRLEPRAAPLAETEAETKTAPDPTPAPDPVALRRRFVELTKRGEYREAYGVMRENPGVVTNRAEDLLLAADAARLSGHPERALEYLKRITTEHRRDSRAPLAAFTLGRILLTQLGRPSEAERAFALTRELAPGGALFEDALARQVEAAARAGAAARARSLAIEYTKRYPQGERLDAVQRQGGLDPIER